MESSLWFRIKDLPMPISAQKALENYYIYWIYIYSILKFSVFDSKYQ